MSPVSSGGPLRSYSSAARPVRGPGSPFSWFFSVQVQVRMPVSWLLPSGVSTLYGASRSTPASAGRSAARQRRVLHRRQGIHARIPPHAVGRAADGAGAAVDGPAASARPGIVDKNSHTDIRGPRRACRGAPCAGRQDVARVDAVIRRHPAGHRAELLIDLEEMAIDARGELLRHRAWRPALGFEAQGAGKQRLQAAVARGEVQGDVGLGADEIGGGVAEPWRRSWRA